MTVARQSHGLADFTFAPRRAICVYVPARHRSRPEGIVTRHALVCATHDGRGCDCRPGYQAQVWSARDRKTIRKTFRTLAEARAWRAQAKSALSLGAMRAPTPTKIAEAAEAWLGGAKAGVIRTRSGDPYKPSAFRSYEQVLRAAVIPSSVTCASAR